MPSAASTKKVFTIGLASLQAGAIDANNGTMPSSGLAQHGNVYRDTLNIETTDTTFDEFFEEEVDQPVGSQATLGDTNISFEILRPSVADLVFWAGGTADGGEWKAPIGYVENLKAIQINSKQGYKIEFPKCEVSAAITGGGQKSTPMRLKVTANVLVPSTSAGVDQSPMIVTEPSSGGTGT